MKRIRFRSRRLGLLFSYSLAIMAAALGWLYSSLPDALYVEQGQSLHLACHPYLQPRQTEELSRAADRQQNGSYAALLSVGGILPIKEVRAIVTERKTVTVCGSPFGIKMFSEGALIVGFTDLYTATGQANPAKEAGLRLGDRIIRMDDTPTPGNEAVADAISHGQPVQVLYMRDSEAHLTTLTPLRDETGAWRAGMWVRDSSAGVGTLTFVDESSGIFAGLGHSISDSDTGQAVALRTGEIVDCAIIGYTAGSAGAPGELQGQFTGLHALGSVIINGSTGVYGTTRTSFAGIPCEVAFAQEVTAGPATILTTIDGKQPQEYTAQIERLSLSAQEHHDMVLRITDPALLQTTGGIVQGMSGSPILQNGRLIGAVTHVLINDPTRGYGIFAQTMLEETRQAAEQCANLPEKPAA